MPSRSSLILVPLLAIGSSHCSSDQASERPAGPDDSADASHSDPRAGGTGGAASGGAPSRGGGASGGVATGDAGTGGGGSGGLLPKVGTGGSAPAASDAGSTPCERLPVCESFEDATPGLLPTSFHVVNPESDGQADSAVIDSLGAHGSNHSLKVKGAARIFVRFEHGIATLGSTVHARFSVRFDAALPTSHSTFATFDVQQPHDDYDENQELRFGAQDGVFHFNAAHSDHNVPSASPTGNAASFTPVPKTWYCVELIVDKATGHLSASVDGAIVPGLVQDGVPTPDIDTEWLSDGTLPAWTSTLVDFSLGWRTYGGAPNVVWFDDVAVGDGPLPCAVQ